MWQNPQETLVTFTEEILNGKPEEILNPYFLCSELSVGHFFFIIDWVDVCRGSPK